MGSGLDIINKPSASGGFSFQDNMNKDPTIIQDSNTSALHAFAIKGLKAASAQRTRASFFLLIVGTLPGALFDARRPLPDSIATVDSQLRQSRKPPSVLFSTSWRL